MPFASHRLDLYAIPGGPDSPSPIAGLQALRTELVDEGWLTSDGAPGARRDALVEGGFAHARIDRPSDVVLYANQQGGFRVTCPVTGENVVAAFVGAVRGWRVGGPRSLVCSSCRGEHPLEALVYRPDAAFGKGALVLCDVASSRLTQGGLARIEGRVGSVRIIGRRVS